ncbi:hypothetical protein [Alloactinosynnema sp. L-07]|uniref:S-4TM family putative pore-forming effector n=1 Tax=Alloactinosynnema sp. L-07 TaxID=1653480 RepID=UPI00065EF355|nr:S-4TM family putative pore-forming effector [Alloactinosynnema sp. L-07]CRK59323.1 hypothetical protein [Alloactinosynnema sp. L-07]
MTTPRSIDQRQLDGDMVRLQRAAAASHQRGQAVEAVRTTAAGLLAAAGVVVTLAGPGRQAMAIIGFAWFLVSAFPLRRAAAAIALQGALLQEMFDTSLFRLPWRTMVAGDPIPEAEVHRLARRLKSGCAKDNRIAEGWYDPTGGVHHPYDVLMAQEQNLAWDARLRRRYAAVLLTAAACWSLLGAVTGILVSGTTLTEVLLGFYVPSLSAYQLVCEIWAAQQRVAAERERLVRIVTSELRAARPGSLDDVEQRRLCEVARDVQDGILRTRVDPTRVPEWFYRRRRPNDEMDFAATTANHQRRLIDDCGIPPSRR